MIVVVANVSTFFAQEAFSQNKRNMLASTKLWMVIAPKLTFLSFRMLIYAN